MPFDTVDLTRRAYLSEWMDEPSSYEDFRDCLRDLARLNRVSFAHRPTLRFLERLASNDAKPLHIVDVGCGGGDLLRHVEQWAHEQGREVLLTGIDLNPLAARAAHEFSPRTTAIRWITGDAFSYRPEVPIDCVVSSLFTHHLPDAEIVHFLRWMEMVAARGWFINDLYRARFPYYGVRLLAWAAGWHRFVRHDGPVSVRRAFTPVDWRAYLEAAGLAGSQVEMTSVGPARLCLSRFKA